MMSNDEHAPTIPRKLTVLDYAKQYITAGFQVHPCYPPTFSDPKRAGKVPKLPRWQQRTLTYTQFEQLYKNGDNLGVVTGITAGFICIDIDPRNGGNSWYAAFENDLGNPLVEKTGSGGVHLYYRYPQGVTHVASRNGFAAGVDILADGGKQVITAPSIHSCGKPYIINDGLTLLDLDQADYFPKWLLNELTLDNPPSNEIFESPTSNPTTLDHAINAIKSFPPAVSGQAGDLQTLKAFTLLRSYGVTQETAYTLALQHYNPRCTPPWDKNDLYAKCVNAYKYAKTPAGSALPENQFPTEDAPLLELPKEPAKSTVVTLSLNQFLGTEFHKKEHYIGPFVKQGISLVYAATGVGKTHFCIGLAFAIASGSNFLRWKCEEKARVLYIDGELPGHYLKSMIEPLYQAATDKDIHFDVITPDTQNDSMMPNLGTPEGQASVQGAIDNADVIFVDNLSTLIRSGKENEAEYWIPVQSWFLKLRRQGKSVIFVHHAGKGESGSFRGTSKITDALDLAVQLKSPSGHKAEDGCVFEVRFPKYRHFRKGDATEFQATYLNTEFGPPSWEYSELDALTSNKVLELHTSGMKPKEIAAELEVSLKTVYKWLQNSGVQLKATRPTKTRRDLEDDNSDF